MSQIKSSQDSQPPAGSPPTGEPLFLVVGKLRHTHGLHGEILMDVITDFPERIMPGKTLFIGESRQPMKITGRRIHGNNFLLSFDGFSTPETIGQFRNQWAYVPASDRPPLPEGEYYHHQLIGLQVISEDGLELGRVDSILETGANDVYVVRSDSGREALIPAIQSVILAIDLEKGQILVHLLPGLLPE